MKSLFTSRSNTRTRLSSNIVTMFSLDKEKSLSRVLTKYAWKIISISTGKTKVAPRLRRFNKFFMLIIKYYKNHGAAYTIKWLKACHLSVQRKLSNKPCSSLRDIEPNLPCPRLINGLPTFIGTMDRKMIRMNHPGTIRLWLSILSIYRILKGPLNPKLNTITDEFKGSSEEINKIISESLQVVKSCKGLFKSLPPLSAHNIERILSAGPNRPVSYTSIFTDAVGIAKFPEIYEPFRKYSLLTKSSLIFKYDRQLEWLGQMIEKHGSSWIPYPKQCSSFDDICLGKLSFKEEAAGKLRVFAIADIWTQSLFKPLHDSLFTFLKRLPNDGTFDQDESFRRCLEKAQLYNCAFSVDLSSATDRLPIKLQSKVIDLIYNLEIGDLWASILVDRPYMIRPNKYGIEEGYVYYATGQPMGALSSWAMLATTHHFILQVCARRAYPHCNVWFDRYEILGDDLVIFDNNVYQEYISMMALLDVGTNPSKSLFSDTLSALEFAKRTGVNGVDVSGISWKQFISDSSLMGRINLLIHFAKKGLVTTIPMILCILGNAKGDISIPSLVSDTKSKTKLAMEQSLMALLGHFITSNKLTLKDAVAFTIDPRDEDMENLDNPSLPIIATLHEVLRLLNTSGTVHSQYEPLHISQFENRKEIAEDEVIGYMADSIVRDCLSKALMLCNNYDLLIDDFALSQIRPKDVFGHPPVKIDKGMEGPFKLIPVPKEDSYMLTTFSEVEVAQIRSFAEMYMLRDRDPQDLHDELYNMLWTGNYSKASNKRTRSMLPSMEEATEISNNIESWESSFKVDSISRAMTRSPVPWLHKDIMNAGNLKVTPYWKLLS